MSRAPRRILAVDDDPLSRELLADILRRQGYQVECAEDGRQALDLIERHPFPVVVTDLKMPGLTGIELLKKTKSVCPETEVIIETAYGSVEGAVEAVKSGAFDYVTKPFSPERIETLVARAVERHDLKEETRRLREELGGRRQAERIIGGHPRIQAALDRARLAARTDATVLIRGESGTGKDLFARLLHEEGPRRDRTFVKVSCAALPETLLDAELFGHERCAFSKRPIRLQQTDRAFREGTPGDDLP
jgi:two-component system response regulator AtoC